jgi:NDP-sugar pyrophosphorylase family protein
MKKTLLVLADGMGSRFGGLKQIEPVGPNGEFIIDYSIFDAVRAGFDKVIFIIKEENFDVFKETIGKRIEGHVEVDYVFQNLDNVPSNFTIPSERVKPLGTAHAILCCKDKVEGQFAIINSDDFYGAEGYQDVANFMNNNHTDIGIVGYNAATELSPNGPVKR